MHSTVSPQIIYGHLSNLTLSTVRSVLNDAAHEVAINILICFFCDHRPVSQGGRGLIFNGVLTFCFASALLVIISKSFVAGYFVSNSNFK